MTFRRLTGLFRNRMIYYESVRGCPYRCNFCNYPFLFSDDRFRYKSASRMVEEWEHYVNTLDIEYITCLDSLFTVPRRRLVEFCRALSERRLDHVKWICYARADDLAVAGRLLPGCLIALTRSWIGVLRRTWQNAFTKPARRPDWAQADRQSPLGVVSPARLWATTQN